MNALMIGEGGHALVWISDDPRRYVVQMTSGLKIGTLSLHLRAINP